MALAVHPSSYVNKRSDHDKKDDDVFINGSYKEHRKPALSATHELRQLREDVAHMEQQMQSLRMKWRTQLPDQRVLLRACEAAKAKWMSIQTEQLNLQLKEQLLQQQLYLASLQYMITQSPLLQSSKSKEIFEGMHSYSRLEQSLSMTERAKALENHCKMGLRITPALINRFMQEHVAKATTKVPLSYTSVMADENYTYFANLLVCKIPHPSLQETAEATMTYISEMGAELEKHVGISSYLKNIQPLQDGFAYQQLYYRNGPDFVAKLNTTFAYHFTPTQTIVMIDFIDDDDLYPTRMTGEAGEVTRDSVVAMMLSMVKDPITGQDQIMLQRMTAIRYNLAPHSATLHHEVKSTLPWFNGDLLMEVICRHLDQRQRTQLQ